jgi:hypothetical protein
VAVVLEIDHPINSQEVRPFLAGEVQAFVNIRGPCEAVLERADEVEPMQVLKISAEGSLGVGLRWERSASRKRKEAKDKPKGSRKTRARMEGHCTILSNNFIVPHVFTSGYHIADLTSRAGGK